MNFWSWRQQQCQAAFLFGRDPRDLDGLLQERLGWTTLDRVMEREPSGFAEHEVWLTTAWQQHCQTGIPIPYVVGEVDWRDLRLGVSPAVLIPRPETELLVDLALNWLNQPTVKQVGLWADVGTGSGAIALGLAKGHPQIHVQAVDVSAAALAVATANVQRVGLTAQVTLLQGEWLAPLTPGSLQGIVSNPPYIPSGLIPQLDESVRAHEPHLALDGGASGLEAVQVLIEQAPDYVLPGGFWGVELMIGQAPVVSAMLAGHPRYGDIAVHTDLAGIPRFVTAQIQP
ncbi:MAG: peptide chain release factor N(5)-glutamine methyltransferase [Synechococcales cyanobacterium]